MIAVPVHEVVSVSPVLLPQLFQDFLDLVLGEVCVAQVEALLVPELLAQLPSLARSGALCGGVDTSAATAAARGHADLIPRRSSEIVPDLHLLGRQCISSMRAIERSVMVEDRVELRVVDDAVPEHPWHLRIDEAYNVLCVLNATAHPVHRGPKGAIAMFIRW